jgi:hypothetical protein
MVQKWAFFAKKGKRNPNLKPQPIILTRRESLRVIDFANLPSDVINPLQQMIQVGRFLVVFFRVA